MKHHRYLAFTFAAATLGCTTMLAAQSSEPDHEEAIDAVLDDFHEAAAEADFDRYFAHYYTDGVFLGTDATERWTVQEFRVFAKPIFDTGAGWVYIPRSREVVVDSERGVAWFDEILDSAKYGTSRGSGTMLLEDGRWLVAQYHLTFPIPNDLAAEMTAEIKAWEAGR